MNRLDTLQLAWIFFLAAGLSGCGGPITKAEYPNTWPSRVTNSAQAECLDISGSYKASNGDSLLPFFLFGIPDTTSLEWANLVHVNEQLLAEPDGAIVTIGYPDSDHIEVVVAMHGTPIAKQVLTRSRRPAPWVGQREPSFRCGPDGIVIVGANIINWCEYRLPYEEKKRRYRRPGYAYVGTSRGYYYFSKATNGSLVMRQHPYYCAGLCSLDELWRRWEPVLGIAAK